MPRPSKELHETRDGNEMNCVVIVIVDDDHEIVIAAMLVLCDLVVVVHGGRMLQTVTLD
jgi:hypothetical protein